MLPDFTIDDGTDGEAVATLNVDDRPPAVVHGSFTMLEALPGSAQVDDLLAGQVLQGVLL